MPWRELYFDLIKIDFCVTNIIYLLFTSISGTLPQVDKNITVIQKTSLANSPYVPGTMEERFNMVWPLTCEAVSLSNKYDVEQRLQRHIINIKRKF